MFLGRTELSYCHLIKVNYLCDSEPVVNSNYALSIWQQHISPMMGQSRCGSWWEGGLEATLCDSSLWSTKHTVGINAHKTSLCFCVLLSLALGLSAQFYTCVSFSACLSACVSSNVMNEIWIAESEKDPSGCSIWSGPCGINMPLKEYT